MKRFYVVTNAIKDAQLQMTRMVENYLSSLGSECVIEGLAEDGSARSSAYRRAHITSDIDCIIVLGGDGTVLQAAGDALSCNVPILGINLGTMGYLAEVERSDWKEALARLVEGDYEIEERMMLEGRLVREGTNKEIGPFCALNDIVFARTGPMRTLNYDIRVNGQALASYHADGMIIATPTGSTAYNLSAGGPIVEPGARMILLTPICPHTLNTRSIVFAPDDEIAIRIGKAVMDAGPVAEVNFDGNENIELHDGDQVLARTSSRVTRLVKLRKRSFLETLRRKLN